MNNRGIASVKLFYRFCIIYLHWAIEGKGLKPILPFNGPIIARNSQSQCYFKNVPLFLIDYSARKLFTGFTTAALML